MYIKLYSKNLINISNIYYYSFLIKIIVYIIIKTIFVKIEYSIDIFLYHKSSSKLKIKGFSQLIFINIHRKKNWYQYIYCSESKMIMLPILCLTEERYHFAHVDSPPTGLSKYCTDSIITYVSYNSHRKRLVHIVITDAVIVLTWYPNRRPNWLQAYADQIDFCWTP